MLVLVSIKGKYKYVFNLLRVADVRRNSQSKIDIIY